jgi:YHS domain-containing protein
MRTQPTAELRRVPTTRWRHALYVRMKARGEGFRIVQLHGNLLVCSKAHGNCCCGWTEKGRAPVNVALYEQEWERRKIRNKLHLTFTGCLGPCAVGNNALLQLFSRSIWFKDLNGDEYIPVIFEYIEAMLRAGHVIPPPPALSEHVYERYLPPPGDAYILLGTGMEDDGGDLERLDPVCLMDVEPTTARWKSEYEGRTFFFCAPGCKKAFDRDPQAYLVG